MNQIKPISAAPKDRDILIAWGTKASGCMGFVIGKSVIRWNPFKGRCDELWIDCQDNAIEKNGFCIFGWYELPPIPKEICVG